MRLKLKIHSTALISPKAVIGENVSVGAFTIVHDNVVIGDNCIIESHCILGASNHVSAGALLKISNNSHIRSHSIFYEGSTFGEKLVTGHRVTVREKTIAGENLQIGTLSDIQGDCAIGDFVRMHSNVHIGQKTKIGNFVWIFPYVVFTNDPHPPSNTLQGASAADFSVIATMSVVLPGANIAKGVLLGAHSTIKGDTEADMVYAGSPAKLICPTNKIKLKNSVESAYPWRRHFHRGYPEHIVNEWNKENFNI
jgi:UDP-3-O-[3-hydroxymyristoyl] glucosamine N-acyltransferase